MTAIKSLEIMIRDITERLEYQIKQRDNSLEDVASRQVKIQTFKEEIIDLEMAIKKLQKDEI